MAQKCFIQVILPLKLEWEPLYSFEYDDVGRENGANAPLCLGERVRVPFGAGEYIAVVSNVDASAEAGNINPSRIKPVSGRADGLSPVSPQEILLWRQVAQYYLCTVGEVYKAAYPAVKVTEEETRSRVEEARRAREVRLAAEAEEKKRSRIARLQERLLKKEEALAKAKKGSVVERLTAERDAIAEALRRETGQPADQVTDQATDHATGHPTGQPTGQATGQPIILSPAQEKACREVETLLQQKKPVLLNGITGSGKTEIYLKLAEETLASGRNVLMLVPEIALSRQLEERIATIFPSRMKVFHSAETALKRYETAAFMRSNPYFVLGTRSSLFLPHRNLGLVIVDEEHDTSYKQDSTAPRYNGRETAIFLAGIFKASVVLGTATPSLESLYNCSVGRYGLVTLSERFHKAADSDVEVIDTIAERRKNGMVGHISRKLIARISERLAKREQVLLLRERRAYSPMVQCEACGKTLKCKRCNVALSLHRKADGTERLVCHYCGKVYEYAGKCPDCGGKLVPLGAGTQKIEEELKSLFPQARIARLDSDSSQSRSYSQQVIRDFSKGDIDILVGTQIVAKGFDFSGLTLVAVLQADSILGQEDYRADERGLQLLEQFRGRSGRRGEKGLFVIQTSQPDHPVYKTLDGSLPESEMFGRFLAERKAFGYPPFSRVIGITIRDTSLPRIELMARDLSYALAHCGMTLEAKVVGPYAPAVDKVSGRNIRCLRVLLPKDASLKSNKEALSSAVLRFEKDRKYPGHMALDVDPV